MLSRALILATVTLLISFATVPVQAQNLEAGKTPSQIFSGTCTACHKSPRGLLKTVAPGALPGFLRQHYTTSSGMAEALSAFLVSNGASDKRYDAGLTKQGQEAAAPRKPADAKPGAPPASAAPAPAESPSFFGFGRRADPVPEAKPEPEAAPMTPRQKRAADRAAKRAGRPAAEAPDAAKPAGDGAAAEAPREQKQKLGKKGRRNREEAPKPDTAKDEPAKMEPAKPEMAKPQPKEEAKPEAVRPEPARSEPPAVRADPVPAVTPAPAAEPKAEAKPEPSESKPATSE